MIGKPSPLMPQLAMEKLGYGKEKTAVMGDRIYMDIKSILNAGVAGAMVMSGETTPQIYFTGCRRDSAGNLLRRLGPVSAPKYNEKFCRMLSPFAGRVRLIYITNQNAL